MNTPTLSEFPRLHLTKPSAETFDLQFRIHELEMALIGIQHNLRGVLATSRKSNGFLDPLSKWLEGLIADIDTALESN